MYAFGEEDTGQRAGSMQDEGQEVGGIGRIPPNRP